MLALFGAAFLGSVIGWCARRIVALKDERYMRAYHEKNGKENEAKIANLNQQLSISDKKIEQLQSESNKIDAFDATMAATQKELDDVRREQTLQEKQIQQRDGEIRQRDDEIRQMREELNTHRLVALNTTSENRKLLDKFESLGYSDVLSSDLASIGQSAQINQSDSSQQQLHGNSRQDISSPSISIDMQSDVEDVDSDIADLTADLSGFLPMQENDRDTSVSAYQEAALSAQNSDDILDSPEQESSSEIKSSLDSTKQVESEEAESLSKDKSKARSGLFSSFNRRTKRS